MRHKRPTDFHTETQERRCSGQHSRHRGIGLLCEGRPGASPRPRIASRTAHIQRSTQSNVSYITPRWYGIQNLAQGASISRKFKADETNVSQNPSIESLSAKPPMMQQGSRLASRRDTIIQVKPVDRRRVPHLARGSPWLRSRPKPIRQKHRRLLDHPRHPRHHMPSHANNTCANHAVSRERSGYLRGASSWAKAL